MLKIVRRMFTALALVAFIHAYTPTIAYAETQDHAAEVDDRGDGAGYQPQNPMLTGAIILFYTFVYGWLVWSKEY